MPDTTPTIRFRPMHPPDIGAALALWRATDGVGLSSADDPGELERFIAANEGLCWCAVRGERLVGTVLCGSDGRRAYLYHVAVEGGAQRTGVGRRLVAHALDTARAAGIAKCHAMVFASNEGGRAFWECLGWDLREDLVVYSREIEPQEVESSRDAAGERRS